MAYRVEVLTDNSTMWCDTGERFRSIASAQAHARHLYFWWRTVRGWRIVDGADRVQPPSGGLTVRRPRMPSRLSMYYEGGDDRIN